MTRQTHFPRSPWQEWQGLGGWNLYFMGKLALLWAGYLNYHPLPNLVFLAFLLLPLSRPAWRRVRHWLALPLGVVLLYHDTWLPGIDSIMSQGGQLFSFSFAYLMELLGRFINWDMVGIGFVMGVAYLFLAQWLRFTPWIVLALGWLWLAPQLPTRPATGKVVAQSADKVESTEQQGIKLQVDESAPPTSENLGAYLNSFYAEEQGRRVTFPTSLPSDATPFDVLIINICSLAWSDVEASDLTTHPVGRHFDIFFKHFNSATSYSGPASIRLLRASCGQPAHSDLYGAAPRQCLLMENLAALGFEQQVAMDHSGAFGNYLKELNEYAGLQVTPMKRDGLPHDLTSFDGEPIYRDDALFQRWLDQRAGSQAKRNVTFFNLIALHDGNRYAANRQPAPYKARLKNMLDQLDRFLTALEQSGRKVVVLLVPEHGAALTGDRMQMSGLRDIPSPAITRVPVGVALIGTRERPQEVHYVDAPSSYLAVSELVSRLVGDNWFDKDKIDWSTLLKGLPETPWVAENQGATVIEYQDKNYIKLGKGEWVPYPR
ncbi:cellulose biosynthesis protein BcsG [Aeromonas schubertii]|uniref:cellulose biosynthesis protein BcsG n=1 Tax=Aeromonas schubertii TaxID=652 RepID=UPI001CC33621|nr:cellulose biosynthesis protein BcsG [Aeromonas schubertii]MBZ6073298.1 cellulose biosynthesis protein BcsG [Aeromonas schubertii]